MGSILAERTCSHARVQTATPTHTPLHLTDTRTRTYPLAHVPAHIHGRTFEFTPSAPRGRAVHLLFPPSQPEPHVPGLPTCCSSQGGGSGIIHRGCLGPT